MFIKCNACINTETKAAAIVRLTKSLRFFSNAKVKREIIVCVWTVTVLLAVIEQVCDHSADTQPQVISTSHVVIWGRLTPRS